MIGDQTLHRAAKDRSEPQRKPFGGPLQRLAVELGHRADAMHGQRGRAGILRHVAPEEIAEAVSYGVIKMNIDTDTQWAFWDCIRQFYKKNEANLQGQLGNPEGPDKPNKKYYDPRVWLRKGEDTLRARIREAFEDLLCVDVLK